MQDSCPLCRAQFTSKVRLLVRHPVLTRSAYSMMALLISSRSMSLFAMGSPSEWPCWAISCGRILLVCRLYRPAWLAPAHHCLKSKQSLPPWMQSSKAEIWRSPQVGDSMTTWVATGRHFRANGIKKCRIGRNACRRSVRLSRSRSANRSNHYPTQLLADPLTVVTFVGNARIC